LSNEPYRGNTAQGFLSLNKQEQTGLGSFYEDLNATIAEYAEQESAYKARVRQTKARRDQDEKTKDHNPE
jgi:hypothetical protein